MFFHAYLNIYYANDSVRYSVSTQSVSASCPVTSTNTIAYHAATSDSDDVVLVPAQVLLAAEVTDINVVNRRSAGTL